MIYRLSSAVIITHLRLLLFPSQLNECGGHSTTIIGIKLEKILGTRAIFSKKKTRWEPRETTNNAKYSLKALLFYSWVVSLGHGMDCKLMDGFEHPDLQNTLYPSINWAKASPVDDWISKYERSQLCNQICIHLKPVSLATMLMLAASPQTPQGYRYSFLQFLPSYMS